MFETAEIGNIIEKTEYERTAPKVRADLLAAQHRLAADDRSALVVIGGVEGAGKARLVDLFLEWMDARGIEVHAFEDPTDEERQRPRFWRYWRALPPKRKMAIMLGSWYTDPIINRAFKCTSWAQFDQEMDRIVEFERMLVNEGTILIKLWLHLSKKDQKKRLEKLESDPQTRWRVTENDWKFHHKYDRFRKISERAISKTSLSYAPWSIIEASDSRYRNLTAAKDLLGMLSEADLAKHIKHRKPGLPKPEKKNIIANLNLNLKLADDRYEELLKVEHDRLGRLARKLWKQRKSMILAFEGPDAAGKGGAIRRITRAMDARSYRVISTAAPTDEEKAHPYLWRFWREIPRACHTTIYDRSWYGRVLVERIEGFSTEEEWRRAYSEISAFEEQLIESGILVLKFWLAISPEEQLRRFKSRQTTPFKQYKLTEEDWRNRAKWDAYVAAACDMIAQTSTSHAPWVLVEAEDKNWARIKVLRTVSDSLEKFLS